MNRLAPFSWIFVASPKIEFFLWGGGVGGIGPILTNFDQIKVVIFHSFKSLGTSACRKNHLGIILSKNKALTKNLCFDPKMISCLVGDFFVPRSLGRPKKCPDGETIGTFFMNICWESNFFLYGGRSDRANFDQFWPNFELVIFHLKLIPNGVLRHTEIPRDISKWKIPTSKFGHFWQKTLD